LSLAEAPHHPHNVARKTFVEVDGVIQPAPAPRFSRTPGEIARPPCSPGEHTQQILLDRGFSPEKIESLRKDRIIT
jgi:alpha-methylacyl-CoA racemase